MIPFVVFIPARYDSVRFPHKVLADIKGKPMIQWTWEAAVASDPIRVIITTDNQLVYDTCKAFGAEVHMSSSSHQSGTSRIAEAVTELEFSHPEVIIVNVQADEPLIPPSIIKQVAHNQYLASHSVSTLKCPLDSTMVDNINTVKVVVDHRDMAMYFSRSQIPYDVGYYEPEWYKHIGIYAYNIDFLLNLHDGNATKSTCGEMESLEQLNFMYDGHAIHVATAVDKPLLGVDTPEDLERLLELIQ